MASRDRTPADDKAKKAASSANRRRIAGESAAQKAAAKKAPGKKAPAKKAPAKKTAATPSPAKAGSTKTGASGGDNAKKAAAKSATTQKPSGKPSSAAASKAPDSAQIQTGQVQTGQVQTGQSETKAAATSRSASVARRTTSRSQVPKPTIPAADSTDGSDRSDTTSAAKRSTSRARRFNFALIAALLVFALGAATLVWGFTSRATPSFVESRDDASRAAADGVEAIFSIDYRNMKQHHAKARALLTSKYAGEYKKSTEETLNDAASQSKATTTAEIRGFGARPCGTKCQTDKVEVLVFFDVEGQGATPNRQVMQHRVMVSLILNADDEWKIDDIRSI